MERKRRLKFDPGRPDFVEPILAEIRAMSPDELPAMFKQRPEGVEQTNMNEILAERDRKKRQKAKKSEVA